jgi:hypothetical protein
MRTTLDIEPDILETARSLAAARRISLGKALSWLARRGAAAQTPVGSRNGFAIFSLIDPPEPFGPDDVRKALEAEDRTLADNFAGRP